MPFKTELLYILNIRSVVGDKVEIITQIKVNKNVSSRTTISDLQ